MAVSAADVPAETQLLTRQFKLAGRGEPYTSPTSGGTLATLDPALLVTPPDGLEAGYMPIVTRQEDADQ